MESKDIPRTGRIGRFAKIIEKELGESVLLNVMQDSDSYSSLKAPNKADWWRLAIKRLEMGIGKEDAVEVMKSCGRKCCGQGIRKTAKRLKDESKSLQEFLERASNYEVKEGEIEYRLEDENTIVGIFHRCFCGQVRHTKVPFENNTYCRCSAEFHKKFFEAALEKPIRVELVQSIISGANNCKFIMHIEGE